MEDEPASLPPPSPIEEEPGSVPPLRAVPSARRHSIASGMIPLLAATAHAEQYPNPSKIILHSHIGSTLGDMMWP